MFRTVVFIAMILVASTASAFWGNNSNNNWGQGYGDGIGSGNGTADLNSSFNFNMTAKSGVKTQNHLINNVNNDYRSHARSSYGYVDQQSVVPKDLTENVSQKPQFNSEPTRSFFKSVSFEERLAKRDEMIKAIEARRAEQQQAMQLHREEIRQQIKLQREESRKRYKLSRERINNDG